jgi:hypothetical protein
MRKLPKTLAAFTILSLIYVILGATLPPNSPTVQTYHLSVTEYHVLTVLVSIPLIAVWFAAFYGYARLQEYVALVDKSADGPALGRIATGLKYLAWGLPISSLLTAILGGIVHSHPGLTNAAFIIIHYVPVIVSLIAFAYIGNGSRALIDLLKHRASLYLNRWFLVALTIIGVLFSYFTIQTGQLHTPNAYYLPMWLILFTIVVPYLFAWFMGLIAAYEIYFYSRNTKGLLYRRALWLLAVGILITILTSIMFQYLQSDTTRLRRITFNWFFLGVYVLLLLYATGFLMITAGVKKLRKIEEV